MPDLNPRNYSTRVIIDCCMLIVQKLCLSVMGKKPRKVKGAKSLDLQSQTQGNQLTSRRERHLGREYTDTQQSGHLFKSRKSIRQNLNKNGVSGNGILQVEVTLLVYLSFNCFLICFTGNGRIKTLNFNFTTTDQFEIPCPSLNNSIF